MIDSPDGCTPGESSAQDGTVSSGAPDVPAALDSNRCGAPMGGADSAESVESAGGAVLPIRDASALDVPTVPSLIEMGPAPRTRLPRVSAGQAIKNGIAYLLADAGVFALVIASQVGMSFLFAIVYALAMALDALPDNGVEGFGSIIAWVLFAAQLLLIGVTLPWWRWLQPSSFSCTRRRPLAGSGFKRIVGLVLLGIGLQMVLSCILTFVLPLFPALETEYDQAINSGGTSDFTLIAVLASSIGAPISEELACRGLMFEFSLRAVCPEWRPVWRERARCRRARLPLPDATAMEIPPVRFWIANAMQAVLFGILHGNLVQGLYTFGMGMMFGWIFWRTGRLRYNMGLHLALNFSSYFVEGISYACGLLGPVVEVALYLAFTVCGARIFVRNTAVPTGSPQQQNGYH